MAKTVPSFVPPHNLEAEQAILGGVLLNGSALDQVVEVLRPDDPFKGYVLNDGCRYGLDEAFVRRI